VADRKFLDRSVSVDLRGALAESHVRWGTGLIDMRDAGGAARTVQAL
jgi:hypothetical protein